MKKLLVANFKSNKSVEESNSWIEEFVPLVRWNGLGHFEVAVAPAFPSVEEFSHTLAELRVPLKLAIQDLSAYPAGSYTGAVSFQNIANLHVSYAIVGHSERRKYFGETSELVAKKVTQAVEHGITPLVCIDEPYLEEQINVIESSLLKNCIFCYEPLAAIGTGKNVGVDTVRNVKKRVQQLCGDVLFMYGGSVNDQNVSEYLLVTDGVLVASFALDAKNFSKLVATATGA